MKTTEERGNRVQRVLLIVLVCNLLVSVAKIAVGLTANLQSVLADGFHSISDGFSNVIGLIGVAAAKRPSDEGHTYGHSRYETLASLAIVALMVYLGISILVRSVRSLGRTDFCVPSAGEFAAVAGTLLFNILTAWLEDRAGRQLRSSILRSDARHTLSDIFVTCGVLVSMALIIFFGAPAWVDSAVSVAIALVIFGAAYRIFRDASDELTDHIAVDPREIEAIVRADPDVRGVHKIRSRRSGDMIYADFHVQCDPEMPLREVHALTHRLEALLNERLEARISCVIHPEAEKQGGRND